LYKQELDKCKYTCETQPMSRQQYINIRPKHIQETAWDCVNSQYQRNNLQLLHIAVFDAF